MHLLSRSLIAHLQLVLLSFIRLSATSPTVDAVNSHTYNAQGGLRLVPSLPTTGNLRYARKHSPIARDLYHLPNGWIGRVDKYGSLLPVQIAASVLENFYNLVIAKVSQKWIQQQPVNSFTISWENIELEFSSATRAIPWNFVLAFAQRLVNLTQQGFVGKYDMYYIHLPTGVEVSIRLVINLVAAGA